MCDLPCPISTSGPGCSKPDANPGFAGILILGEVFCLYCLPYSLKL